MKMNQENRENLDLAGIREKLAGMTGQAYWRGLEEIAETEEFQQWVSDEFPNRESLMQVDRRSFLKVMGASLALAGVAGCRFMPEEKMVPYIKAPEDVVPGKPLLFASAMPWHGYAKGILVTSREGRPIKIDGNPTHPSTLGSSDIWMQAAILDMYDPDRAKNTILDGNVAPYEEFLKAARAVLTAPAAPGTAPFRILIEPTTSPTLAAQAALLKSRYPGVRFHEFEPAGQHNVRGGSQLAFGQDVDTVYHFDKAKVILALDGDFLQQMPGSVRYARDWAAGRRVRQAKKEMNRTYAVESTPTLTGANADHRIPMRASDVDAFARALAAGLGVSGVSGSAPSGADSFLQAAIADLKAAGASALVVPGDHQSPAVHALAHAINAALGAVGTTVTYLPTSRANLSGQPVNPSEPFGSLKELVADMQAGQVAAIIVVGGNPVFTAPSDVPFAEALKKVKLRAHLGSHEDETSAACNWHIPESHFLEAWGDLRGHDGTACIVQPLIAPIYESHSAIELVAALADNPDSGYNLVRKQWQSAQSLDNKALPLAWEKWLNDGVIAGTAPSAVTIAANVGTIPAASGSTNGLEVVFRPDPNVLDGRYVNNGWLQEIPKAVTKLTWDNAILISPAMAEREKLGTNKDNLHVVIKAGGKQITGPVWITPGHPDNSVTVTYGYGRTRAGQVGTGIGFNGYPIRTSGAAEFVTGAKMSQFAGSTRLVSQQMQQTMEGREPVRLRTLADYTAHPEFEKEHEEGGAELDLFKKPADHEEWGDRNLPHEYKWGMAIDLNVCIGCNACSMACQAENNIPVVGKEQVAKGRHMNWIRVDRYYEGKDINNPKVVFQPVPCMHCEKAPCEPVCPVAATVHSHEGLNMMIYNRCVGTRYCSNNCPYKVRRFNFLNYANHHETPVLKLLNNPEVTVRGRGVMEKCTYCVQRINHARIDAKIANNGEGEAIKMVGANATEETPGVLMTACQQACPTKAISFGAINRPDSEVSQWRQEPAHYKLLEELNTEPRTTYLARLRNPNTAIEPAERAEAGHGAE
jgi:molybdopterin-containing oxidoreductase family iron-sulfur binding subunit